MLKTPRTLPERFNAPESALHQNQEKCPPCRARCPHRTLHLKDHAKGGDTPQGRVWDSPLRYAANPGTAGGGRPRPCKGLRENCAPYRAPSPIGPHTQTGQGTVPHVVQRPGPAPHHIHPLKTASRRRAHAASLFPITWACRCTAGHSTTDGSA